MRAAGSGRTSDELPVELADLQLRATAIDPAHKSIEAEAADTDRVAAKASPVYPGFTEEGGPITVCR